MQELVDRARALTPSLRARADQLDAERRLPSDLVEELRSAGFFRMFVPRSHGGHEIGLRAGMAVLEALATADPAVGWTVMIGSETPQLMAFLGRETFDKMYAAGPDVIVAGGFNPQGTAVPANDGFQVDGRWAFGSGSTHADWIFGNCVVLGADGGPRPGPVPGTPLMRSVLVPASQARVVDTWQVLGLRGTGSHDVEVRGVQVPNEHTFDLFAGTPSVPGPGFTSPLTHFILHLGAVAVGIAQGALDATVELATSGKQRLYARARLADSQLFQANLGRADLSLRAARALLESTADEVWALCSADPAGLAAIGPRVSATLTWVTDAALSVVDTCYRSGGGQVARDASPVQRRFRDMHTFSQHAAAAEGWLSGHGAALVGAPGGLSY
ncbi:flavin-dependent monooxygenase [Actinoplanes lobatus]|uniref:Alkylation response protein AidB-like acyl-CoA dehydrogenase n=1 Tax=Actinoplanes lobatus TaxID=113568 RepID=A0A7W7HNV0_9ACTN|nr:acyl-CoA dehydrogenase family protein [Actinoplanes lobatus]MBB4753972.1 alkylation response protein AidB-like acyl-CoA dehydrogenase [Actinoplanes lobatus]GGN92970.1 flavin-dependent monooxygenase [Actinoplanes lobatus]GIE44021.1 flavin-dependent monooxygenase [Actinoplanes lobatus]